MSALSVQAKQGAPDAAAGRGHGASHIPFHVPPDLIHSVDHGSIKIARPLRRCESCHDCGVPRCQAKMEATRGAQYSLSRSARSANMVLHWRYSGVYSFHQCLPSSACTAGSCKLTLAVCASVASGLLMMNLETCRRLRCYSCAAAPAKSLRCRRLSINCGSQQPHATCACTYTIRLRPASCRLQAISLPAARLARTLASGRGISTGFSTCATTAMAAPQNHNSQRRTKAAYG